MINHSEVLEILRATKTRLHNFVDGRWTLTKKYTELTNPVQGTGMLVYPDTQPDELEPFLKGLRRLCPKSGLHNPFKNVERYRMLGEVSFQAAGLLENKEIADYFAFLIQSVMPKSYVQCMGEVKVVRQFLKNFSGDQVRFLASGHNTPGDHAGQQPQNYPWPFGPVVIITPFNFPLEIPALQLMGALYMGNRPLIKSDEKAGLVTEQFLRLLHICGLPAADVDLIHCTGLVMYKLLQRCKSSVRLVQFTGSSEIAEKLAVLMRGKVSIEDSGYNWKILGPDYRSTDADYVARQCDQDAYAASGQKCSAESILFKHKNWGDDFWEKLRGYAATRNLSDLTVGPVLTWTTEEMLTHLQKLITIPGAKILFGGKQLRDHHIPECYGAIEPTAVFIPIQKIVSSKYIDLVTTEVFGPVQVVTEYTDAEIPLLLILCEKMRNHLTAAVVSRDQEFIDRILGATVNGTTYVGIRARTTGAPQNHWFGPSGDPRGAGIGTPEAIILTWSAPRCVVRDTGPIDHRVNLVQS
ncbi:MAG: 1-pyrroline-5-carboxylate dehydrogenase [Parcubacteria group bacterium Gr01-1014_70]|nr:MAG: 1-pyrroline-5-carboxylate dehydrogenase [Parcubacteria group bacterium Gr01-1014_70]